MARNTLDGSFADDGTVDDTTPSDVGDDLGGSPQEDAPSEETMTPHGFGSFAHQAYEAHADERFDDVDNEVPVRVTKRDGSVRNGKIDTTIDDDRILVDYKTGDMRDWEPAEARREGNQHGRQMQEYVESPDTPDDARGWVISTVPPEREDVRQVYAETLDAYGVGARFSESEQPDAVMDAVQSAVDESTADEVGEDLGG